MIRALLFVLTTCCCGCAYVDLLRQSYADDAVRARTFRFADGGEAIYYEVEVPAGSAARAPDTWVFVVSGSDCTSMKFWLPRYFTGLGAGDRGTRILVLHKRFIKERTWGRELGCDDDFIRADHPSRWIADQREFIASTLAAPDRTPGNVVLLGISEGSEVVPLLACREPKVTHLVLVAGVGADPWESFRRLSQRHGFSDAVAAIDSLRRHPPADPDAVAARYAGRSWRYWSELHDLRPTECLLALEIPVLVGVGGADALVPAEDRARLRQLFEAKSKSNLTMFVFPDADHALVDVRTGQSRLPEFFMEVSDRLIGSGH